MTTTTNLIWIALSLCPIMFMQSSSFEKALTYRSLVKVGCVIRQDSSIVQLVKRVPSGNLNRSTITFQALSKFFTCENTSPAIQPKQISNLRNTCRGKESRTIVFNRLVSAGLFAVQSLLRILANCNRFLGRKRLRTIALLSVDRNLRKERQTLLVGNNHSPRFLNRDGKDIRLVYS